MTATKYCVVRYVPNPLSGEAVNVGVIVWNQSQIESRFINDWRRLRAFGGEDVAYVRNFVRDFTNATSQAQMLPGFGSGRLDAAKLEHVIGSWTHSIEFSEPRASVEPPSKLLEGIASLYLRSLPQRTREVRDRRFAARVVLNKVSQVLTYEKGPAIEDLIQRDYIVAGKLDQHRFDVAVANGRAFLAAQGLSFEGSPSLSLQKEIDATAWAIDDVRKKSPKLPLGIFTLPPKGKSDLFTRAKRVFAGLDAKVTSSEQIMGQWVHRVAENMPPELNEPKVIQRARD